MSDESRDMEDDMVEKSHTFRKRRLTLSSRYVDPASEANTEKKETRTEVGNGRIEKNKDPLLSSLQDDSSVKTRSVRKRRLTLTKKNGNDFGLSEKMTNDSDQPWTEMHSEEEPCWKKRRLSENSQTSSLSSSTLGSKTHHAGQISLHPSSPSITRTLNRLYAPPFNTEKEETEEERNLLPLWKRRMTRNYSEDETELPFPRHIVGQYSCHGIEPVYDSDFDDSDGKSDDGESHWHVETSQTNSNIHNDHNSKKLSEDEEFNEEVDMTNTSKSPIPELTTCAKINQDRGGIAFPYGKSLKTALFAVYDGHGQGGELVSQYALHHIQKKLKNHPNFNDDIEKAFKDTFLEVDEELKDEPSVEPLYSGTTACVVLFRNRKLVVSNAGDSRAVLARKKEGNFETINLSEDQNPDSPKEKARIERCGGYVSPPPEPGLSARVWLDSNCTQIGLAMSRSIGDHAVKEVGVVAEPVVTFHEILPQDAFLILASDGVWEFITSEEAVEIVGNNISKGSTSACQLLIETAAERWHEEEGDYRDDITALVVQCQKVLEYFQGFH